MATLGFMSFERATRFKTPLALWTHNVARNPASWMAKHNLGTVVFRAADELWPGEVQDLQYEKAARLLRGALNLQPAYAPAHCNLGLLIKI